jgi:hypothetical protein
VKTALIIGGAAVGVYVLFKVLAPKPALPKAQPSLLTQIIGTGGLGSVGSALGGLFKGGSGGGSSADNLISAPISTSGAATAADLSREGFNTGNYTAADGFAYTDASGNFVAG